MANPKLRFKADDGTDFPEWRQYKLGNLGSFKKGKGLSKDQLSEEGNPCILYGQLYTNYNEVIKSVVSKTNASLDNAVLSEGNEVLFPNSDVTPDGIACASYLPFANVILGGDISVFKCNEGIRGDVLSYIINSPNGKQQIYRIAQGTTVIHTSASSLSKILVNYPSSQEEQRKIADFLSTFDLKVEAKEQQLEALQETKKGLLQQIFSQQLRFKAADGTEYPEWDIVSLSRVANSVTAKNKDEAIKNVLTVSAKHGIVEQHQFFDKKIANDKNICKYTVVNNMNFVYNPRISKLAPAGPIKMSHVDCGVVSPLYTVFRVKDEAINIRFLDFFFQSNNWIEYLLSIANFGARYDRMSFNKEDFYEMPILKPCQEEQRKIAEFLGAFDEKIEAVKRQLEALREIKKGLLQQMFV